MGRFGVDGVIGATAKPWHTGRQWHAGEKGFSRQGRALGADYRYHYLIRDCSAFTRAARRRVFRVGLGTGRHLVK